MSNVLGSKKGVSPLIATVLLIAFAVALGSVVMNWGLSLNKEGGPACASVRFQTRDISSSQVCFGGSSQNGYINFILDNTGGSDINGIAVAIIGSKGTQLKDVDALIKKGSLYTKNDNSVVYDFDTYGEIKEIQFIPKVAASSGNGQCPESAIKIQAIGQCA